MRRFLPLCLVFVATSAQLLAERSEAEVRADIAFARGLAENWGFVDLSQEVIGKLESGGLPAGLGEEVALLKCEVYFAAAKINANERDDLLKRAMSAYQDFVDRNAYSALKDQADAGLVEVAGYYARSLAMKLEDSVGPEAATLREELQKVLESAVARVNELLDGISSVDSQDLTEAMKRRKYELLLTNGELCLEWAKIQDIGTANFKRSNDAFERLSFEAGEGTPWSLRAYIGIGDNFTAQANAETDFKSARALYREAAAYYEFAVNFSIPRDAAAWAQASAQMSRDEKQARFLFVQMGTPGLLRALLAAGDSDEAVSNGLHFYNAWKREGLDLVQPVGHLALLEVARMLVDAGGIIGGNTASGEAQWFATAEDLAGANIPRSRQKSALDFALSIAQQVASDNKGNTLQVRAQKVIGEIISRPGIVVDPGVLLEAAQGEFNQSNWADAIDAMKRVVVSLQSQDQATRQEMMPKVLWHIARSYQRLDRTLEAAATYEYAVDTWSGDPQYDEASAKGFYDCVQQLKRVIRGDATIEAIAARADNAMRLFGSGATQAEIAFRDAEKLFGAAKNDAQYERARARYAEVDAGSVNLEKAIVSIGLCDYRMKRFESAIRVFQDYLERFVPDPKNVVNDATRVAKRRDARALATFYWGIALFQLAEQGKAEWRAVIERLGDYHTEFPEQDKFAPAALYQCVKAHAALNESQKVRELLEVMLQRYPDDNYTGRAATESYNILSEKYAAATDPAQKQALLREMAENLETLNKTSAKPSFRNLRAESRHWMDLGEWAKAEILLGRIRDQFGDDPEAQAAMPTLILPDLGEALVRQDKVDEAKSVLEPLVAAVAPVRATRATALNYVQAVSGWATFDEAARTVREHVGAGANTDDFEGANKTMNDLVGGAETGTTDWFRYKAQQIYFNSRWAQYDGKKLEYAKELMQFVTTNLGADQYKHPEMPEDLRQIFVWLANKLR